GAGIVYGISMGNALKWFPDRRGLAAGLTAAAFGAGSAATVLPIRATIEQAGYEAAFLWFGLGQGVVVFLCRLVVGFPGLDLARPVFGWVSDHFGRERAMFVAFTLEGSALLLLIRDPGNPVVFVLMSGLAFFGWGAIFSLFPAVTGDLFGRKFATTNYGLLYT